MVERKFVAADFSAATGPLPTQNTEKDFDCHQDDSRSFQHLGFRSFSPFLSVGLASAPFGTSLSHCRSLRGQSLNDWLPRPHKRNLAIFALKEPATTATLQVSTRVPRDSTFVAASNV